MGEAGVTGLVVSGGVPQDQPLRQLRGTRAVKVWDEMSRFDSVVGAALFAIEMLARQAEWRVEEERHAPCLIPLIGGQVLASGKVTFCHCIDYEDEGEFSLGNIREKSLSELYNGEKNRELWEFGDNGGMPSACRRCTFYRPLSDLPSCEHIFYDPLDFVAG